MAVAEGWIPARWKRIHRLTQKELRETLRDRRTILTLVLMPILVYPLLSVVFQQFFLASVSRTTRPVYRVVFRTAHEGRQVARYLARSGELSNFQVDMDEKTQFTEAELLRKVREREADIAVLIKQPESFPANPRRNLRASFEIIHDTTSTLSRQALDAFEKRISLANESFLAERLETLGIRQSPVPVRIERYAADTEDTSAAVTLSSVIPLILILMTITGAVYPAIDLTAGERERNTLEVLIAAPIPRLGLLLAKYFAVLSVAMLTATVNLVMMTATITLSGLGSLLFGPQGLTFQVIWQIFCLLFLFAAFFSAVLLTLTSFARSFKEAQAYLIPLMLLSLAPGILSLTGELNLKDGLLSFIPLLNIVLLGRDLLNMQAELRGMVTVVVSTSLYALAAVAIAGRVFGSEGVLYGSGGGWSDLWRRPQHASKTPTVINALVCSVFLFLLSFVAQRLIPQMPTLSGTTRLLLSALSTICLFGAMPLFAAWHGRLQFRSGFSVHRPRAAALLGAILLGLSLWVFVLDATLRWQMESLQQFEDQFAQLAENLALQLRSVHIGWVLLALAVIPAFFEELFFRGYLLSFFRGSFSGMPNRSAALQSIVWTALVFGMFHFVTAGGLGVERLISSTILGFVLGCVCWWTGSIFPGMVLHACHNSVLLCAGYYSEQIEQWLGAKQIEEWFGVAELEQLKRLPVEWLAYAGLGVGAGTVILLFAGRQRAQAAERTD